MSQLPLPNFGNFRPAFNTGGNPGWPMQTAPSIFGRPHSSSMSFSPLLPIHSFPGYPGCHIMPGLQPNIHMLRPPFNHVVSQERNPSLQQQRSLATNVQGSASKTTEIRENVSLRKEFSCDACQKDFSSKETLTAHLGSHIQCSYEGCTFKAGRKVLKLHWIQTHETGRMKIKLDTPEEIEKWREERKRKYPTLANVQKKMEEDAKRKASGQVLKTKNFRYRRGQGRGRSFQQGGRNHFNNRCHPKRFPQEPNELDHTAGGDQGKKQFRDVNQEKEVQPSDRQCNVEDPLSLVLDDCVVNGQGNQMEECASQERLLKETPAKSDPASCSGTSGISALSSLCTMYASDSEEDKPSVEINNNTASPPQASTTEEKGATKCTSADRNVKKDHFTGTRRRTRRSGKPVSKGKSNFVGVRKSTLLEKLLAPDIRHERNLILQCLRYIVKKKFFIVGDTSVSENVVNH